MCGLRVLLSRPQSCNFKKPVGTSFKAVCASVKEQFAAGVITATLPSVLLVYDFHLFVPLSSKDVYANIGIIYITSRSI